MTSSGSQTSFGSQNNQFLVTKWRGNLEICGFTNEFFREAEKRCCKTPILPCSTLSYWVHFNFYRKNLGSREQKKITHHVGELFWKLWVKSERSRFGIVWKEVSGTNLKMTFLGDNFWNSMNFAKKWTWTFWKELKTALGNQNFETELFWNQNFETELFWTLQKMTQSQNSLEFWEFWDFEFEEFRKATEFDVRGH